jgi:serine/threonine-protein kinase
LSEQPVREELARVLGSETFAQSESLKRFLQYVVEAKLEGREGELKEQVLGAEVFGRGETYDPRIDPIVRVQATRLRSKLRDYYQKEGAGSDVVLSLPKGSYVPSFASALRATEKTAGPGRRLLLATAAVLAVAGLVVLLRKNEASSPAVPRSVAVLPFTDMSPGGDHEYFADALAEEITMALASIEGLDVVPRTSAFRFKGEKVDLKNVATELGCDALLQGSVRVSGEKLRVQAQLVSAASGRHLWTETYDRPLEDAFDVQEAIARAVARAVAKNLTGGTAEPPPRAYDDYLRATFEREKNTPLSLARSIQLFESAIEADPDFASAHAGLVQAYVQNLLWALAPPEETRAAAREAAERALALGTDHPEARAAAASYRLLYEGDVAGAASLLERGDGKEIRLIRGVVLSVRGRLEEAAREIDLARKGSRQEPLPHHLGASIAFHRGDGADALARIREVLEWAPDHALSWLLLARIQMSLGRLDEAEASLSRFGTLTEAPAVFRAYRAILLHRLGRSGEAEAAFRDLKGLGYAPPILRARVHAARGETDEALRELEQARAERSFGLLFIEVDPDFAALRGDARFRELSADLGFAEGR